MRTLATGFGSADLSTTSFGYFPELPLQAPFCPEVAQRVQNELINVVGSMAPGEMLLDKREFSYLNGRPIHAPAFVPNTKLSAGINNSAHKVEICELKFRGEGGLIDKTTVAVKPHDELEVLAHEWVMSSSLGNLSEGQATFLQLGTRLSEVGTPQSLTLYEDGLETLDEYFWPSAKKAPSVTTAKLVWAYRTGFRVLGLVEGAGFKANDMAAVRNIVVDPDEPVHFCDLETVEFAERSAPNVVADSIDNREAFEDDVYELFSSSLLRGVEDDDPVQITNPIAFERAVRILRSPMLLKSIHKSYQQGIIEGSRQSGVAVSPRSFPTFRIFAEIADEAIQLELTRPEPTVVTE